MTDETEQKVRYSVTQANSHAEAVKRSRLANKSWAERRRSMRERQIASTSGSGNWRRESRVLPREEARDFARNFLKKYPKAAYWSEVESWRVLEGDMIEFTMRRLPSAD